MMTSLRKTVRGVTIDGLTSKDLDDAICVETYGNVGLIQVHIADPTEFVELGSNIDREAKQKLFTKYLRSGNSPMLLRELSEDKCSLLPLQERAALTVEARVDQTGVILDYSIYESTLVSLNKFSYEQVEDILYDKKATGFYLPLKQMEIWKDILSCKRQELGAIGALQRKGYFTDEEGRIIGDYSRSQSIVAEYAILANTLVADWGRKENLPLVYRNHQPIATDTNDLRIHMNNLSITREERSQYYHLLGKAKYSIHNKGHFALALPGYLHFTSPLRRFADFVNHRMIKARLRGEQVPYDRKTLENIAEKINRRIELEDSQRKEHFKQKFYEEVSQATDYNALNDKELFNIIKKGNYNEKLLSETLQLRILNQTLENRTTVAALFLSESKSIQKVLIESIPEDEIIQIVNLADALIEKLQVEFFEQENTQQLNKLDPCNQWWCELKLIVDEVEVKATGRGSTKKAALIRCSKKVLMEMEW